MTNLYITIKVLDITNDFPHPSNSKIYKKEPRYSGTYRYDEGPRE